MKLSVGHVKKPDGVIVNVININMTYVKTITRSQTLILAHLAERLGDKVLSLPEKEGSEIDQVMLYSESAASDMGKGKQIAMITKKSSIE